MSRHGKTAASLLFVSTPVTAWSQVLHGSIVGNFPGAVVTITSKERNQVRTTTTNEEGGYSIPTVQSRHL